MKISILLPYRDEAAFLPACLDSLGRQTYRDFELVAVNDGSRDRSSRIVETFANRFPALVHAEAREHGLVGALETALSMARGEVIARADGDDIYHPLRLELQLALLERGYDLVGCGVRFFPRPSLMEGFRLYEAWINRLRTPAEMGAEIFVETPIAHPSLMMRRDFLDRIGGYRDMGWPEDFDLMLRAFRAGAVFGKVDRVLHFWREHPERHCRSDPRYRKEAFIRCRCRHLARGPLRNEKKVVLWGAGPVGKKTGAYLLEEGVPFEAYVDIDPRKIGGTVHGRKVRDASFLERGGPWFVLGCVAKRGARYLVREALKNLGFRERLDFLLVA